MPKDVIRSAHQVADRLQEHGHGQQSARLRHVLETGHTGSALLTALREVCQTVLTAIEAVDPSTATYVDELRLEVDKRLMEGIRPEGRQA